MECGRVKKVEGEVMGRLIDADKLMKEIREVDFMADAEEMKVTHDTMMTGFFHGLVQGIVDYTPTAYDPDKVVEQIHEYFRKEMEAACISAGDEIPMGKINHLMKANKNVCRIVKKGGGIDA